MVTAPQSRLDLRTLSKYLLVGALIIIAAGVAREVFIACTGAAPTSPRLRRIALDTENSLPAWYSSILLFFNAAALGMIATVAKTKNDTDAIYWIVLAWVFLFLSADEVASLHERLSDPVLNALDASGVFFFAWVIPYGAVLFVLTLSYARFLLRLPRRSLILFGVAGVIYLGGAIGMDMVGGAIADKNGADNTPYVVAMIIEETLEIAGMNVFFVALRRHLEDNYDLRAISVAQ